MTTAFDFRSRVYVHRRRACLDESLTSLITKCFAIFSAVLACCLMVSNARADIVYSYVGNSLSTTIDTFQNYQFVSIPVSGLSPVIGTADFAIPSGYTGLASPTSLTLSQGGQEISIPGSYYPGLSNRGGGNFLFYNGQITQWSAHAYSTQDYDPAIETVNDVEGGTSVVYDLALGVGSSGYSIGCNNTCGNANSPGAWTISAGPGPSACQLDLTNALYVQASGAVVAAHFQPTGGLAKAEADCGVAYFNWAQSISYPAPFPNAFTSLGVIPPSGTSDPPPGGWDYQRARGCLNTYPFYYSFSALKGQSCGLALSDNTIGDSYLGFADAPGDPCLPLAPNATLLQLAVHAANLLAYCGGQNANGSAESFTTTLVGVTQNGMIATLPITDYFSWGTTWNGTTGGTFQQNTNDLPDIGSGTGEAFITSVNGASVPEPECAGILLLAVAIILTVRRSNSRHLGGI